MQCLAVLICAAENFEGVNPALLDLVQLPLSLFDLRLLQDGTLFRLRAAGKTAYARSLYLQDLLFTSAEKLPPWVSPNCVPKAGSKGLSAEEGLSADRSGHRICKSPGESGSGSDRSLQYMNWQN